MTQVGNTLITREISIDMAHRVTNHAGKCRNVHGHRYTIKIGVEGIPFNEGEQNPQEGMLIDFGFIKDEMLQVIDRVCDHGMMLWRQDELVIMTLSNEELQFIDDKIVSCGYGAITRQKFWGNIIVVPFVPTAENLAKWWFDLLKLRVYERSGGLSKLQFVQVFETPNCTATYSEGSF